MTDRTIKYIGEGEYLYGVPARDLTPVEYEKHRAVIEACPRQLYIVPEKAAEPTEAKTRGNKNT